MIQNVDNSWMFKLSVAVIFGAMLLGSLIYRDVIDVMVGGKAAAPAAVSPAVPETAPAVPGGPGLMQSAPTPTPTPGVMLTDAQAALVAQAVEQAKAQATLTALQAESVALQNQAAAIQVQAAEAQAKLDADTAAALAKAKVERKIAEDQAAQRRAALEDAILLIGSIILLAVFIYCAIRITRARSADAHARLLQARAAAQEAEAKAAAEQRRLEQVQAVKARELARQIDKPAEYRRPVEIKVSKN